jgi:hypothetical protein
MRALNTVVKKIIFLENIAVIVIAYRYGHNLLFALAGLVLISITVVIGSKNWEG